MVFHKPRIILTVRLFSSVRTRLTERFYGAGSWICQSAAPLRRTRRRGGKKMIRGKIQAASTTAKLAGLARNLPQNTPPIIY